MDTVEKIKLAMKAIEELTLGLDDRSYIDGVITTVLMAQADEYEALLVEANNRYRGEGKTAAEFQAAYDAVVKERDELRKTKSSVDGWRAFSNSMAVQRNEFETMYRILRSDYEEVKKERDEAQRAEFKAVKQMEDYAVEVAIVRKENEWLRQQLRIETTKDVTGVNVVGAV